MKQYLVTEGNDYQWYGASECKTLTSARRLYSMMASSQHAQIWRLHDEPGMVPRYEAIDYYGESLDDIREADKFREALGI